MSEMPAQKPMPASSAGCSCSNLADGETCACQKTGNCQCGSSCSCAHCSKKNAEKSQGGSCNCAGGCSCEEGKCNCTDCPKKST